MADRTFYILDVFAEEKYAGNQLAVVRDSDGLSDTDMQRIAKEMNYSETTFILSKEEREGGYDVRIFTPEKEVPFAGHPTLGTAYTIQQQLINEPVDKVALNLKVGQIPVSFKYKGDEIDVSWMKQNPPAFGKTIEPEIIAKILDIDVSEIDTRYPIEEVTTGLWFFIVPLKSRASVEKAQMKLGRFFEFIKECNAKAILIFSPEPLNDENNLHARVFAHYYGVSEDPATGSANGCLTAYLVKNKYFGENKIDIRVEQGYEIKRPSLLLLRGEERENDIDVFVGGRVIMTAEGILK